MGDRRKRVALVMLGVMLPGLFWSLVLWSGPGVPLNAGRPRLLVEETFRDLGEHAAGSLVHSEVTIVNTGTGPLHISKVRSTCGCTEATITDRNLPPGGSSIVAVDIRPATDQAETNVSAILETNDPDAAECVLRFRVRTSPMLDIYPPSLQVGLLDASVARRWQFTATVLSLNEAGLTAHVRGTSEQSPVSVMVDRRPGERASLRIEIVDPPIGPLDAEIAIVLADSSDSRMICAEKQIAIAGFVNGPVEAVPNRVVLSVDGDHTLEGNAEFRVRARDPALTIVDLQGLRLSESLEPHLAVEFGLDAAGASVKVRALDTSPTANSKGDCEFMAVCVRRDTAGHTVATETRAVRVPVALQR